MRSLNPENQQNGGLHFWSFQVTVGSGRPTARQYRLTFSPSFTDTSLEMLTILAGTEKNPPKKTKHKNRDKNMTRKNMLQFDKLHCLEAPFKCFECDANSCTSDRQAIS